MMDISVSGQSSFHQGPKSQFAIPTRRKFSPLSPTGHRTSPCVSAIRKQKTLVLDQSISSLMSNQQDAQRLCESSSSAESEDKGKHAGYAFELVFRHVTKANGPRILSKPPATSPKGSSAPSTTFASTNNAKGSQSKRVSRVNITGPSKEAQDHEGAR